MSQNKTIFNRCQAKFEFIFIPNLRVQPCYSVISLPFKKPIYSFIRYVTHHVFFFKVALEGIFGLQYVNVLLIAFRCIFPSSTFSSFPFSFKSLLLKFVHFTPICLIDVFPVQLTFYLIYTGDLSQQIHYR